MVQAWYPALPLPGYEPAPYAPPAEAASLQQFYPVPAGAFEGATTNSLLDAPALPERRPVVLFAHGLCGARTDTTALNERLASLGFVVVAVGTTHEMPVVEFPDVRTATTADPQFCLAGGDPFSPEGNAVLERLQQTRVADMRFVLDELAAWHRGGNPDADGKQLPAMLGRSLDLDRVGMVGHSFGGSTTAQTMLEDQRVKAGVNLDGLIAGPVRHEGVDRPYLVMGSDYHDTVMDPSWADFLPALSGWHQWLQLRETGHYRFIDLGGSTDRWGLDETLKEADPQTWDSVFGDIAPRRSQEIVLRYTSEFLQHFLLGRPAPLLDGPSPRYPEVVFREAEAA